MPLHTIIKLFVEKSIRHGPQFFHDKHLASLLKSPINLSTTRGNLELAVEPRGKMNQSGGKLHLGWNQWEHVGFDLLTKYEYEDSTLDRRQLSVVMGILSLDIVKSTLMNHAIDSTKQWKRSKLLLPALNSKEANTPHPSLISHWQATLEWQIVA